MTLWIGLAVALLLLLVYAGMLFIRKTQFDAVHNNFLELSEKEGGRVSRSGFATRPSYAVDYKERRATISINSEKQPRTARRYYLALTMQARSRANFTLLSAKWLKEQNQESREDRRLVELQGGEYLLEATNPATMHQVQIPRLEKVLPELHPFAYVLATQTGIILERIVTELTDDTRPESLQQLLGAMQTLCSLIE